jgi:hypothetical protein
MKVLIFFCFGLVLLNFSLISCLSSYRRRFFFCEVAFFFKNLAVVPCL